MRSQQGYRDLRERGGGASDRDCDLARGMDAVGVGGGERILDGAGGESGRVREREDLRHSGSVLERVDLRVRYGCNIGALISGICPLASNGHGPPQFAGFSFGWMSGLRVGAWVWMGACMHAFEFAARICCEFAALSCLPLFFFRLGFKTKSSRKFSFSS